MTSKNAIIMSADLSVLIKEVQKKFHLSIRQIAILCEVSARTIYRIKKGHTENPVFLEKILIIYCQLELKKREEKLHYI